ncbi:hormone-sensitive lipase [Anaeramoeba flamelloides]|uniref:Hormone-sensitive lipase n=1 Tax=Anaeramoeba flamelloides TaxID=1746091 RepID=A0ABQ8XQA9_9EUKA|nr:hormone-sensitive lipase [Anaeramoeba flamelloides]
MDYSFYKKYNLSGKELNQKFDLSIFLSTNIQSIIETVIKIIVDQINYFTDQKEKRLNNEHSLIEIYTSLYRLLEEIKTDFYEAFVKDSQIDIMLQEYIQDLQDQVFQINYQKINIQKDQDTTIEKRNENYKKKRKENSKHPTKTKKTTKGKQKKNLTRKFRSISWLSLFYCVVDTLYHTYQTIKKVKYEKKNHISPKKLNKLLKPHIELSKRLLTTIKISKLQLNDELHFEDKITKKKKKSMFSKTCYDLSLLCDLDDSSESSQNNLKTNVSSKANISFINSDSSPLTISSPDNNFKHTAKKDPKHKKKSKNFKVVKIKSKKRSQKNPIFFKNGNEEVRQIPNKKLKRKQKEKSRIFSLINNEQYLTKQNSGIQKKRKIYNFGGFNTTKTDNILGTGRDLHNIKKKYSQTFSGFDRNFLKLFQQQEMGNKKKLIPKKSSVMYTQKNHKNFWCNITKIFDRYPDLTSVFFPSPYIFVYQYSKEMSLVLKTVNASNCAMGATENTHTFITKWVKYGCSMAKNRIMTKTAAKTSSKIKEKANVEFIEHQLTVLDLNRMFRWVALHPYPRVQLEKVRYISRTDPNLKMTKKKSKYHNPLAIRIISGKKKALSVKRLVFFVHGGAFVAGGTLGHASYLRSWVKELDCTVVAIEYTIAPKKRYVGQLSELFSAWKWLIKRAKNKKIIIAGDSAGGCLSCSLTMKTILENVRRPDGLIMGYPVLHLRACAGPARLLFANDPFFSYLSLLTCLDSVQPRKIFQKENAYYRPNFDPQKKNHNQKSVIKENKTQSMNVGVDSKKSISLNSIINESNNVDIRSIDTVNDDDLLQINSSDICCSMASVELENEWEVIPYSQKDLQRKGLVKKKNDRNLSTNYKKHRNLHKKATKSDETFVPNNRKTKVFQSGFEPILLDPFQQVNWEEFEEDDDDDNGGKNWLNQKIYDPIFMENHVMKQFPPTILLTGLFDPFLDECSLFSDRMWLLGKKDFILKVYGLPHAFWTFGKKFKFKNNNSMKDTINFLKQIFD